MRQQMVDIARHSSRRSQAQDWVSKMRFLTMDHPDDRTTHHHSSGESLSSVRAGTTDSLPYTKTTSQAILELADRSILANSAAYIAVSYCWNREDIEWFTEEIKVLIKQDDVSIRPSTVPSDVLHRTLTYAEHQGVNAIWIDQECINQDDPIDKEQAIQAMDIVYQDSRYPIAVLESFLETQAELDVFASVVDPDSFNFNPVQVEVLAKVLAVLSEDPWFSRAWTLQESTSAGVTMMLLIGCPGLDKHSFFGPSPGELEITIRDFQFAMVNTRNLIEEYLDAGAWSDTSSAINASNCADVLWNLIPTIYPDSPEKDASHRQQCNAAEAVTFLDDRFNSVFSDRLAILANICNYEVRIDSIVLEKLSYSFSTCALTLAILNGDMSLLVGCQANDQGPSSKHGASDWVIDLARNGRTTKLLYQNDDHDLSSNTYGFSWGPKPSGSLSNITYLEEGGAMFRLKPSTLSLYGLKVCGILWKMKHWIRVPKTKGQFAPIWQTELDLQVSEDGSSIKERQKQRERQKPLIREFAWTLLHELMEMGFTDLVKTLWGFFQPSRRSSYGWDVHGLPRPYSFETIFGAFNSESEANKPPTFDEHDVRNRLYATSLILKEDGHGPTMDRRIIEQVCENGSLIAGIPMKCPDYAEPRVWFESCKKGDLIFTPFTEMGDQAIVSTYRKEAISWRVSRTGDVAENCELLHCLGRRRGFWRFEGLDTQDYILD